MSGGSFIEVGRIVTQLDTSYTITMKIYSPFTVFYIIAIVKIMIGLL